MQRMNDERQPAIRAFAFDMDGTLMDSEILWVEAVEEYVRGRGLAISREEAVSVIYGIPWPVVQTNLIARFPVLGESGDRMSDALRPYFLRLKNSRDIRLPGSIELLRRLSKDYPVCIVSGSWRHEIAEGAELMGIEDCLDFYIGGEQCERGKPAPDSYLLAAEKLGLPPGQCLAFEDSTAGLQAAKRAGMHCVVLARKDRPRQDVSEADLVLDDLALFSPQAYERAVGGE